MARQVKCAICKLKGTNESFISVPKSPKGNYYFCSDSHVKEHEYQELEKRKAKWIMDYIAKLIKYDETKLFPNSIRKELNKLRAMYEYDVIYKCLCDGASTIEWKANNGGWSSEWGMVRYIFSISESKLNDTVKTINNDEMLMEKVEKQIEVLSNVDELNDIISVTSIVKKDRKNIADMLDAEDLI